MDDFIFEKKLKWIPYDKFKNVEYLDEGGFGIIYTATFHNRSIVLKSLNNSNENLNELLNEVLFIYF